MPHYVCKRYVYLWFQDEQRWWSRGRRKKWIKSQKKITSAFSIRFFDDFRSINSVFNSLKANPMRHQVDKRWRRREKGDLTIFIFFFFLLTTTNLYKRILLRSLFFFYIFPLLHAYHYRAQRSSRPFFSIVTMPTGLILVFYFFVDIVAVAVF